MNDQTEMLMTFHCCLKFTQNDAALLSTGLQTTSC